MSPTDGDRSAARARLARLAIGLAALWLLAVSAVKLFLGSPSSLPPIVRDGFFGPDLNYRFSITVEFACGLLALLHPRWGFAALSALFGVFLAVLLQLVASGAESCGCFGGAVTFPPLAMLAIDGSLLAAMLLTRPLRALPVKRPRWLPLGAALAFSAALPWVAVPRAPTPAAVADGAWQLPSVRPRFAIFEPAKWVGKSIHETELAVWMDTRAYPTDATWLLYRIDCDHCARLMQRLSNEFASDPRIYVFVDCASPGDDDRRQVGELPPGEQVSLSDTVLWDFTAPWMLRLEGGRVVEASQPD